MMAFGQPPVAVFGAISTFLAQTFVVGALYPPSSAVTFARLGYIWEIFYTQFNAFNVR
jgi:hypothetical protein